MKRPYAPPRLVVYGRLELMTLGSGGAKPDFLFTGTGLASTTTSCAATEPNVIACLVTS